MKRATQCRKWKPRWKWERAQRAERNRLAKEEKLQDVLKPDDTIHHRGIVARVHVVRSFGGREEIHFAFGRYETDRKRFFFKPTLPERDLDDLCEVIQGARRYCKQHRKRTERKDGFVTGLIGNDPSKDRSQLPVRWR